MNPNIIRNIRFSYFLYVLYHQFFTLVSVCDVDMSAGREYNESARARCKRLLTGKFSKLKSALHVSQKFAFWSREEFIESLLEINRLSCLLVSETRSQLMFSILPGGAFFIKYSSLQYLIASKYYR